MPPDKSAPPCRREDALFLDIDGTLAEFAATPDAVRIPATLPTLLAAVRRDLGGALALVSGRTIPDIDRLFHPHRFAVAGIHGIERRDARGAVHVAGFHPHELEPAIALLAREINGVEGLLIEDKGRSVALHFRQAPGEAVAAWLAVNRALELLPPSAHIQMGNCVYEIKSNAATKHSAIEQFMREAPFSGRRPVFVGDDVTDEDGFRFVEGHGGYAVKVGGTAEPGRAWLADPPAVRQWLQSIRYLSRPQRA